jgi:aminoglycoside phosphotransferase (APT) family kinase protein
MRTPESFFASNRFGIVKSVKSMPVGVSAAKVFAVTTEAGEYILRLSMPGRENFDAMVAAQKLAANQGIAPNIIFADENAGALVMEKANGISVAAALAHPESRPEVLRKVAATFARLHKISAPGLPVFDPVRGQEIWEQQARRDGFPSWAQQQGGHIYAGVDVLDSDQRRVFGHNDVNPTNMLWDGQHVSLIDWESASLSHPYIDLAIFSTFTILPDEDAFALLSIQEDTPIEREQRRTFSTLLNYVRAIYGAVFLRLVADLSVVTFTNCDETLTLSQCYALLRKGELDLRTPSGQALFGAAILRQID